MSKDNKPVIVIVEDEPGTSLKIEFFLKQFFTIAVGSGEEALIIIKRDAKIIDLILLDIGLPGIDGIEICRRLKKKKETQHIPIIFLTRKSEPEEEASGFDVGAVDFIPKPVNSIVLNARVKSHIELKNYRENLEREVEKKTSEIIALIQENIDTQKEIIFTLGNVIETRSKENLNHLARIGEYVNFLALNAGLDSKESENLKAASILHDIGKFGIPEAILNKSGKLTDEEFEVYKSHTKLGYDVLKKSKRKIMQRAAIIAYQHHEKWDGTGYPQGLRGNDIHIWGRITAIAHFFDEIAVYKSFNSNFTPEEVLKFFTTEVEGKFDPMLIKILKENIDDFLNIFNKYPDKIKNYGGR